MMKQINPDFFWYGSHFHPLSILLLPFSWIFAGIVTLRKWFYKLGICKVQNFPVPVIVVGNLTVGGTGKTPFVIWLAQFLQSHGYQPGIVCRGVGGEKHKQPYQIRVNDCVKKVGDEALILFQKTQCPVVVGMNRAHAATYLLARNNCNVIISDDGLQHHRLGRDLEIMMIDPMRRFGNGRLLPAGPLREATKKMHQVDFVIANNEQVDHAEMMTVKPTQLISLHHSKQYRLEDFPHKKIHVVAGIGNPKRFFSMLEQAGFSVTPHIFPDHHHFRKNELNFADNLPIIMTYKDAVKCSAFANQHCWYLDVIVTMDTTFEKKLLERLQNLKI